MRNNKISDGTIAMGIIVLLCISYVVTGVVTWAFFVKRDNIKTRHDNFKPIKELSYYRDSLVYAANDSALDAVKARYDSLVYDYKYAFDEMFDNKENPFRIYNNFDKEYIYPQYSKEIGVKNLRQYSRYLDKYEQDSLAPIYRNVYRDKVVPFVRNNTRAR